MCAACGSISSPSASGHCPDAFSGSRCGPKQLLTLLNGPSPTIGALANLSQINKGKEKQLTAFWKSPCCIFPSRASRQKFCYSLWKLRGFVASPQMFQMLLYFQETKYSSISDLVVMFYVHMKQFFRAVKTLRSVEPCQLLSRPPRQELKTTVRPVEQGDTVRVDVTRCFIVSVCIRLNRDWTWKAHSKTRLLFSFPGVSPEICCTFATKQSQTDDRSREQRAA